MAKKKQETGISPAGKVAVLAVCFGIPVCFAASSWGLSKVYEIAPWALILIMVLLCTAYAAYTAKLMYTFYDVPAPIIRFIPCLCEITLIDVKYHTPCYILYGLSALLLGATQLPYSVVGLLGQSFATSAPYYFLLIALVLLAVIQGIKGYGLTQCMKDISEDWRKHTHADVGAITKFALLGYIPFVRVMALYSLNKPLSTLVSFMGVTAEDAEGEAVFSEEE